MLLRKFLRQPNTYVLDDSGNVQEFIKSDETKYPPESTFQWHVVDCSLDFPDGFLGVAAKMVGLLLL